MLIRAYQPYLTKPLAPKRVQKQSPVFGKITPKKSLTGTILGVAKVEQLLTDYKNFRFDHIDSLPPASGCGEHCYKGIFTSQDEKTSLTTQIYEHPDFKQPWLRIEETNTERNSTVVYEDGIHQNFKELYQHFKALMRKSPQYESLLFDAKV